MGAPIHQKCSRKPNYHNYVKFWGWMFNPERITGDPSRKRMLTEDEQMKYDEWLEWAKMKEAEMNYD